LSKKHIAKFLVLLIITVILFAAPGCSLLRPQPEPEPEPVSEEPEIIEEEAINSYPLPPGIDTQVNILLLGYDSRYLSDALVLVTYNNETFESAIISIPRDTYIDFQTWSEKGMGHSAIGWASYVGMDYGQGDPLDGAGFTAYTISQLLNIDIHYYAGITFDGVATLIDQIGGVVIDIAPGFSATPLKPGLQRLDGQQVLRYARHRKEPRIPEPGSPNSDIDRIIRNQRLLKGVLEQCKTLDTDELFDVYEELENKLYTNMEDWDLMILANIFFNQDLGDLEQVVLPGEYVKVYEAKLGAELEYYFLDFYECDQILTRLGVK
jgi:polyisoprenyl-teichoic acid--peptidoglycan teichoic acid transferase